MALAIFDKTEEIKPFQTFLQKEIERIWSSPERTTLRSLKETINLSQSTSEQKWHTVEEEIELRSFKA